MYDEETRERAMAMLAEGLSHARYLGGELGVARVVRAGLPRLPLVVALPAHLEHAAHLGDRVLVLVEEHERELGPLLRVAYS